MIVLRKLLIVFLTSLLVKSAFSQQQYYIYIQSEEHRLFYVRMGAKMLTSSGNGYLVVPGLERNTYDLIVGFPEAKTTEWRFSCTVNEADLGFILKRKSAAELQLLNLRQQGGLNGTVVEQRPEVKTSAGALPPGVASNDPFSLMLADAVNDPSIRLPVVVEQRTAPPVLASRENPVPPSIGDVSSVAGQPDAAAVAVAPVTDAKAALPGIADNSAEKQGSGKLKEPENEVVAQVEKSSKEGAEEKAANANVAETGKKYEPFVVKETPLQGKAKTEDPSASPTVPKTTGNNAVASTKEPEPFVVKEIAGSSNTEKAEPVATAAVENKNGAGEVKYLPFVIKPGAESKRDEGAQQSKAGTAVVVTDEKKSTTPLVKKDNKQPEKAEKGSPVKTEEKDNALAAPTRIRETRVQAAEKKAILSSVKKTLERRSRDGVDLIYIDENINGARDTIRIFIPGIK
jgi:hypothetical protein